jgi:hypothetical protein
MDVDLNGYPSTSNPITSLNWTRLDLEELGAAAIAVESEDVIDDPY